MKASPALTEPAPDDRVHISLSVGSLHVVLSALARLKASEQGNLRLGPGSSKIIQQVERAETEIRQWLK
ncbi:MAG TPA: hypothetical protein VH519_05510 [Hyphomicrobiaceae bacterium]